MAKVLQSFLIGVGLDTEKYDKGAKKVDSSLGRMRSLVGITGAAMVGAFALAGTAAINAGKRVDDFNLAAEKLKTPTKYVHDYGRALAALGGNAEDAVAAISAIEKAQSDFALKGMLGPLEDVALARGDINALAQTKDGEEFLRTLAGMVPQMNKDQQRLVQDTLGLSDSVMRSLRGGVAELDAAVARAGDLYGEFGRATDEAREFSRAMAEINTRFQGIGETLAEKMLPGFTGVLDSMGGFIDRNRDIVDKGADVLGANPIGTTLATGGGAAAATGVALRGIGLRGLGVGLTRFGLPGAIAGGALIGGDMAYDWLSNREAPEQETPYSPDAPFGLSMPMDPVYSGGEVSNHEAARVNPYATMILDDRQQAEKEATPQRVNVQNNLDVKLEVDGRALDSRVTEVIERRERSTAEDLISSVAR